MFNFSNGYASHNRGSMNTKKGLNMQIETVLFLASLVLLFVTAFLFANRDDNKTTENTVIFNAALGTINKRLELLEQQNKEVHVKLSEPIRVNVVYKKQKQLPPLPLLKRSGVITNKEKGMSRYEYENSKRK